MKKSTIVLIVVAGLAVVIALFIAYGYNSVNTNSVGAAGGLLAENYDTYIRQNGGFHTNLPIKADSTLDVADTATLAGTNALTGATTVSGAAIFSSTVALTESSSTLSINGTTDKTGCIKMGDSRGSAYIPVYVTIASSTVTATTTKPAICL